jgi:hypothetical protein
MHNTASQRYNMPYTEQQSIQLTALLQACLTLPVKRSQAAETAATADSLSCRQLALLLPCWLSLCCCCWRSASSAAGASTILNRLVWIMLLCLLLAPGKRPCRACLSEANAPLGSLHASSSTPLRASSTRSNCTTKTKVERVPQQQQQHQHGQCTAAAR